MGQAKIRQHNRQEFLREHPLCAYCGDPATTTDHCPPRVFFFQRHWPETYEFPACEACNSEARKDEQALAVIARAEMNDVTDEPARQEWQKMVRGLVNNQREFLFEWRDVNPSRRKRVLREMFGEADGDARRQRGWGVLNLGGPLTRAAIDRFGIKLGKALYYRHIGKVFEGNVYIRQIDLITIKRKPQHFRDILELALQLSVSQRNNKNLAEQFVYRHDYNADLGAVNAVIRIGSQLLYHILAISADTVQRMADAGEPMTTGGGFRCTVHCKPEPIPDC